MATLKQLAERPDPITGGQRACAGCAFPLVIKTVLKSTETPVVVANATGCMEVTTSIYPYTAWNVPWMHSAFENAAATISGIEAAYNNLVRRGKIDKDIKFVAFGGDGGTYDIGLQSLSGAMERGHNILYVCYDNEAYMNTGIQRSSSTPRGANTTTTPTGKVSDGKTQLKKDLTGIIAAHGVPYVAQSSISDWRDLSKKAEKALNTQGPTFLNVLTPCRLGWGYTPDKTIEVAQKGVDCCIYPLYEVENGEWKLTYKPKEKLPVIEYMKMQNRFRHVVKDEAMVAEIQADVDKRWQALLRKCGEEA